MGKKKKSTNNSDEVVVGLPTSLKILILLSFLGFVASMVLDSSNYLAYDNIESLKESNDQAAYEAIEDQVDFLEEHGYDISEKGLKRVSKMYFYRGVIDVIVLLGVALMYTRLRLGFTIYVIFQLAYITLPFTMFGLESLYLTDYGGILITLVYIGLFSTQRKYLVQ